MDKSSSLDRLMNQTFRPKVPKRQDILDESSSNKTNTYLSVDVNTQIGQEVNNKKPQDLVTSKYQIPNDIKTIRSTIRLEESIDNHLKMICLEKKITKETWIEGAYLYLFKNPEALNEVNIMAQEQLKKRKKVADIKRAITMKERLENF